jgi:hypothetical protein
MKKKKEKKKKRDKTEYGKTKCHTYMFLVGGAFFKQRTQT